MAETSNVFCENIGYNILRNRSSDLLRNNEPHY